MTTSNADDDAGGKSEYGLDGIMEASLIDDLGANSVFFSHILDIFGSRRNSWGNDHPMGCAQDIHAIKVAS